MLLVSKVQLILLIGAPDASSIQPFQSGPCTGSNGRLKKKLGVFTNK